MKQSFIVLGEGLTDLFEFNTLIEYNHLRINKIVYFHTPQSSKQLSSVAMIMNPTSVIISKLCTSCLMRLNIHFLTVIKI